MKRRDFLTILSTVGATVGVGSLGACGRDFEWSEEDLQGARLRFSHKRQGVGYPVQIVLDLPDVDVPPRLQVLREEVARWSTEIGAQVDQRPERDAQGRWVWQWTPPIVRPTDTEVEAEVIRYRVVAMNRDGRSLGLVTQPLEIVCAARGWGC